MKKRAKVGTPFRMNAKSAVFALLLIAAAIAVYGTVNAATVYHRPQEIQPQGIGSTLDSDKLQGLTAADLRAAAGAVTTYRMSVSAYRTGSYYSAKTVSYACPAGSVPSVTYCKSVPLAGGQGCSCSGSSLTALVSSSYRCGSDPYSYSIVGSCQSYSDTYSDPSCQSSCQPALNCEIEFQCGKKETVGTYSAEACQTGAILRSGQACDGSENSYCSSRCTSAGWRSGSSVGCVNVVYDRLWPFLNVNYVCGMEYSSSTCWNPPCYNTGSHVTCLCSN